MRRARAVVLVALAGACGACAIISADDYVGPGDAAPNDEAALPDDGARSDTALTTDASAEAGTSPSLILSRAAPFATGRAQQSHLFYSQAAGRWVFFTFDGTSTKQISTRLSTDFVTWVDGAPLGLPLDSEQDGRDLAVAALPSADNVFHLSISLLSGSAMHSHFHVRATLGNDLVYGTLVTLGESMIGQAGISPDGPAVVATSTGQIFDMSGWVSVDGGPGNANVVPWVFTNPDNGGPTWAPSFPPAFQIEVVTQACNARALVATSSGALGVWEDADIEPMPHGLHTSMYNGTSWSNPVDVGFASSLFDVNDWGIAALGNVVHVVRRADVYEHRVYENGSFNRGQAMNDSMHLAGAGVVLLPDNNALRAYTMDGNGAILTASLTTTSWSSWTEILPQGSTRGSLTGFAANGVAALAWLEERPDGQAVVGWRLH